MKNLKKSVLCMLMAVVMVMTVTAASVIPVQDVYAASVKLNKTSRKGRVGCCRIYPCRGKRQTDPYKKFVENFTFL